MAGACIAGRGVALMACAFACDPRAKFHTSGGPRRRPCLGKGRGRRIYIIYIYTYNIYRHIFMCNGDHSPRTNSIIAKICERKKALPREVTNTASSCWGKFSSHGPICRS